mgnify:CR=1 FL=1
MAKHLLMTFMSFGRLKNILLEPRRRANHQLKIVSSVFTIGPDPHVDEGAKIFKIVRIIMLKEPISNPEIAYASLHCIRHL